MQKFTGLIAGAAVFLILLLLPLEAFMIPAQARITIAITGLMVVWWVTEAIPIYATALVPLVLFPLSGVLSMEEAARSYADNTVFLFMGGFFIAVTMQRWHLHRRIALNIVRHAGAEPRKIVLGFMLATAFISMWISNTATAMMMVPIALAVVSTIQAGAGSEAEGSGTSYGDFVRSLLIGVAYSATIGGMATLIGTPPNGILIAQLGRIFPQAPRIDFFSFVLFALPMSTVLLFFAWLWLTGIAFRRMPERITGTAGTIREELERLGPMTRGERVTLAVFLLAAFAWIFRTDKNLGAFIIPGLESVIPGLQDATIAIAAAILLFSFPVDLKRGEFVLDWETAKGIPWGILVLFGGGICLSQGFLKSGVASLLSDWLGGLRGLPIVLVILAMVLAITFLNEFVSNTAVASLVIPLVAITAVSISVNPLLLMIPAALASSLGFMLPIGTPPNSIVYGTGQISTRDMMRAGLALNIAGSVLITILAFTFVPWVLGLESALPPWAEIGV